MMAQPVSPALKDDEDYLRALIQQALAEDIGPGDVTSEAIVSSEQRSQAYILAKEQGVVAGLPVACLVFQLADSRITWTAAVEDGAQVQPGDRLATLAGPTRGLLVGERLALNFLQRLSGIATLTARYVAAVAGTKTVILDTRKTTPTLRFLEKYAVRVGGGQNHRFGLYDMVLIKDNHIRVAGSIKGAIERAKLQLDRRFLIEVEASTLAEVREAVAAGADRILLDNMSLSQMREAVGLAAGRAKLEASGRMTLERVRQAAETGVDYISVGALTHSAPALDISMEIE